MSNKLPKRLEIIAKLVDGGVIADVGCDHGKLTNALIRQNKCDSAIVSDISASSLNKAINLLKDFKNVESICCDGLSGYKNKHVDQCIISGMGGEEIISIISNSPIEISSYILSPQKNEAKVKKFMLDLGYGLTYDRIICDKGKFYHILKCEKNSAYRPLDSVEFEFGKDSFGTEDFDKFVRYETDKMLGLVDLVDDIKKAEINDYLELLKSATERKEVK